MEGPQKLAKMLKIRAGFVLFCFCSVDNLLLNIYQYTLFNEKSGHSRFGPEEFYFSFIGKASPNAKNLKD